MSSGMAKIARRLYIGCPEGSRLVKAWTGSSEATCRQQRELRQDIETKIKALKQDIDW